MEEKYYVLQYTSEANKGPIYFMVDARGHRIADALLDRKELLQNTAGRGITDIIEEVPDEILLLTRKKYKVFRKQITKVG